MNRRVIASVLMAAAMLLVAPAFASASGAVWKADVLSATRVSLGQEIKYIIALQNVGVAPSDGTGALDITLPSGITGVSLASNANGDPLSSWTCSNPTGATSVHCDLAGVVAAGGQPERVYLLASAGSGVSGPRSGSVSVSGGGAAGPVSSGFSTSVSATPSFGVPGFDGSILNEDGTTDTQAGSHPYALTTSLGFNSTVDSSGAPRPDGNVKDIAVNLPPGLVGDPTAVPQCPQQELQDVLTFRAGCAAASQVGFITVRMKNFAAEGYPVFNMVPPPGEPAQFGAFLNGLATVYIDARVRSGSDYGLTASLNNVSALLPLVGSTLTLWGVPADPSHDASRGDFFQCFGDFVSVGDSCFGGGQSAGGAVKPFLTLPTSCGGPQGFSLSADSWQSPGSFASGSFVTHDGSGNPVGFEGCNRLDFGPSIVARPDTSSADSPSGLGVDVHVPQAGLQTVDGLAAANLKKAVVALPAGFSVNPSSANGLAACSPAQIALSSPDGASCPDASKIGSVEVDTPLLSHPLLGGVYLATQGDNPFGSLLAIYVAVDDPQSGVVVKLAGHVVADPQTGQLTATFDNNPKLPFSDFKLDFFGGQRAALATPQSCGVFQTSSEMTPWSALDPSNPSPGEVASPGDSFAITSAAGGGACQGSLAFAPSFTAGTVSNQANGFSPLSVSFSREDGEQTLGGVSIQMPPGLLGMLSSVPLCGEPAASQGACPAASQIGHTVVSAGVGADPVVIPQAGGPGAPVFLTGPYKGAPFGLSIVVPAVAGPFNLGNVVVRAAIGVDPHTAQVTITSDPLPTILQGIPLRVRKVTVLVDRPGFIFNPTSCNPLAVNGTITGVQGATAGVSSRFQAANCGALPFSPKFSASTSAKTSRANGASLDAKILIGVKGEANAHVVAVQLPKQLPSRLTTIQKACLDSVFNANPAACPAASLVGTATAVTPVLPVALSGPAYLVSHGGAGFPDIVVVLQGDGVRFDLVGSINITSKGITSSKFASAPDAPINSFELKLPQGPHSILTSNGSLCAKPLVMPTTITAYNNKQVKQNTTIKVTGCPKAKKAKKTTHKKHKAKHIKDNAKAKHGTAGRRS